MATIIRVKNATENDVIFSGQTILSGEYYTIDSTEVGTWRDNTEVFTAVANGTLVVNNGNSVDEDMDPITGWNWLSGDTLLKNAALGGKIAVHSSPKPEPPGITTYVIWSGSGDDITAPSTDSIGAGDLMVFNMDGGPGSSKTIDVKFDPAHGRVWIHEAYIRYTDGGFGDHMTVDVIAPATPLIDITGSPGLGSPLPGSPDYTVDEDGWVHYSLGGPGTGTHILAGTPVLLPRTFSHDGDWDWDGGVNLVPNFAGTGEYKMTAVETTVHRYINKIPCFGSSHNYFTLSSDESAELPVAGGYFCRVTCHNVSGNTWSASCFMEIFRERSFTP